MKNSTLYASEISYEFEKARIKGEYSNDIELHVKNT